MQSECDFTSSIKQVVTCSDLENPGFILAIGLRLCEITLYIFLTAFGGKTLGMTDLPSTLYITKFPKIISGMIRSDRARHAHHACPE